jgi:hypothetical protein
MHRRASPNRPRDQWMLHVRIRCAARPGPRQSTMCTDGSSFGSYHNTSTLACRDGTRRFDGNTDAPGTLCHPIPVRQAEHTALYRRAVPTPQYRGVPLCTGVSQTRRVGRVPSSPSALPRSLPHVACCPRAPQPREVAPSPVGSRARLFVRMAVGSRRS